MNHLTWLNVRLERLLFLNGTHRNTSTSVWTLSTPGNLSAALGVVDRAVLFEVAVRFNSLLVTTFTEEEGLPWHEMVGIALGWLGLMTGFSIIQLWGDCLSFRTSVRRRLKRGRARGRGQQPPDAILSSLALGACAGVASPAGIACCAPFPPGIHSAGLNVPAMTVGQVGTVPADQHDFLPPLAFPSQPGNFKQRRAKRKQGGSSGFFPNGTLVTEAALCPVPPVFISTAMPQSLPQNMTFHGDRNAPHRVFVGPGPGVPFPASCVSNQALVDRSQFIHAVPSHA